VQPALSVKEHRISGRRTKDTHLMKANVKMTGPPTPAAKPPPAVVGLCRLTC
jgi:hypothetical protein